MYNGKNSCCSKKTDDEIAAIFSTYKSSIQEISSKRIKTLKSQFDAYKTIEIQKYMPNGQKAQSAIIALIDNIKSEMMETNKNLVSCAQSAMKLTIGLLCSGCSTKNSSIHVGNKLSLSKKACLSLSAGCYKLVLSFKNTVNQAKDDFMALTDTITTYLGDEIPLVYTTTKQSIFGDLENDINQSNGTTSNRILAKTTEEMIKEANEKAAMQPSRYIISDNTAFAAEFCGVINNTFPNSTCKICNFNINDPECKENPIIKQFLNNKLTVNQFRTFIKRTDFSIIPVKIIIPLVYDGNKTNITLDFIFNYNEINTEFIKYLSLNNTPPQTKILKIANILSSINNKLSSFLQLESLRNLNKNMANINLLTKEEFKTIYNKSSKFLKCLIELGLNKMTIDESELSSLIGNTYIANITESNDPIVSALSKCNNNEGSPANWVLFECQSRICFFCLNDLCFDQSFNFVIPPLDILRNYSKEAGRDQFFRDKTISLKTGKKVPEIITLPNNIFALTSFNYISPCANVTDCANWFCSKFLIGPIAKVQKIYNPQDLEGEFDKDYYLDGKLKALSLVRVLAESEDYEISDTIGIDFNAISNESGVDLGIVIDGASVGSDPYVDQDEGGSSFEERVRIEFLTLLLSAIYLMFFG